jgi:hypothetical protein
MWPGGVEYLVVIAPASITENPGFESRQGERFLGLCIYLYFFVVVASDAESRLSQGNLNQPDVAFCFMLAAIS